MSDTEGTAGKKGRSPLKWILYYLIAFAVLVIFLGALWIPLVEWVLSGFAGEPGPPSVDPLVFRLLGDLIYAAIYGLAMFLPVGFVLAMVIATDEVWGYVEKPVAVSADEGTADGSVAKGEAEQEGQDAAKAKAADLPEMGWGCVVAIFVGPFYLMLLFWWGFEVRDYLDACVYGGDCAHYMATLDPFD